jgi:uncharacterized protein
MLIIADMHIIISIPHFRYLPSSCISTDIFRGRMEDAMKIFSAQDYAARACVSPGNIFGEAFFEQHLSVVAKFAATLAGELKADAAIIETAAYLHDMFAIENPDRISEHAAGGGELVAELLIRNGYDDKFARRVAQCVCTHSSPVAPGQGTVDEICISNADAMSQIARPAYWLHYSFCVKKNSFRDGTAWLRKWIQGSWEKMIPQAREIVSDEYRRAMIILAD